MAAPARGSVAVLTLAAALMAGAPALAQGAHRDGIADLISKSGVKVAESKVAEPKDAMGPPAPAGAQQAAPKLPEPKDPREGEESYERARDLMRAIYPDLGGADAGK